MAQFQTGDDGAEGSDAVKDFLFQNKSKFKDVQDLYDKLVQNDVDYSSLMISSQEDLRDILVYMKVNPIDRMKLINVLKFTKESHIYKALNTQSPSSSVVVLSSIQNDFLLNLAKHYESTSGNVQKVQNSMLTLTKTSKEVKEKINKQYVQLFKILESRKNANLRQMTELCEGKRTQLKKQLSLTTTARDSIKKIQNEISQCLNSTKFQFTEKQIKINQIIDNAQLELKSLESFCNPDMDIHISTKLDYDCDLQSFDNFVSNHLDLIVDNSLRFFKEPQYNKDDATLVFKVECCHEKWIGSTFDADLYIGMDNMDDDEKKQNEEKKIKIGTFELPQNKNDTITIKVKESISGLYKLRVYNDSLKCLSKQCVKISRRMCWSKEDKDGYTTLSNNCLTVTNEYHAKTNHLIRTNFGYGDGVHYYQITLEQYSSSGNGYPFVGFALKNAERVIQYNGKTESFWGFYLHHNTPALAVPQPYNGNFSKYSDQNISKQGGVMILKLDMSKRELTLYYDGVKTAQISNMQWNENERIYPALYMGCIRNCKFTAEFNQHRINLPE